MRAWYTLSDAANLSVVQPLLNALRFDSSETVRGTAVRLLGEYVEEFGVREALELAANDDTDAGIRTQAARALLSEQELYRQVRQTFFDSSLSAERRVNALQFHFGSIGPGLSIDADIADELFAIEFDRNVTTTWAGTLLYYADDLDPKFIDPLLELIAGEPEDRATAAGLLGHFNDRPAVVAALEKALEDPDRNVRNNAQQALERTPWPGR
jgi:HEAT repeat protein